MKSERVYRKFGRVALNRKAWSCFVALVLSGGSAVRAAPFTWDGGGADDNWSTGTNWGGDVTPDNDGTATLTFTGTTRTTPAVDSAWSLTSVTFDDSVAADPFTVSGSDITFSAATGVTNSSAATHTINAHLVSAAAGLNMTATSGNLVIGGNVDMSAGGGATLTVDGAQNTTISGMITGTNVTVVKNGAGALTLDGLNPFTGSVTMNAGTIAAGPNSGMHPALTLTFNGGTFQNDTGMDLDIDQAVTLGGDVGLAGSNALNLMGNVDLSGGTRTVTATNTDEVVVSGIVSNGGVVKDGAGLLIASGNNTYAGGTTVNAGTLGVGSDTALGTGGLTISNGTTVHGVGIDRIIANNVTVGGDFAVTSDDIMDFSGTVDLGGATRVITLNLASGGDVAFEGVVSNGGIDKQGDGILILDGNNTYAGGTTLTGGTLAVTHDNALGSGGVTIAGGTTIAGFDGNRNVPNAITVNGDFTIDGDTDPDMGDPDIEFLLSGSVDLGGATRTITVNTNTLAEAELGGAVSNGGLTKTGAAPLILSGTNTYTGTTTVSGGNLTLDGGAAIADTGAVVLADTAGVELQLEASETIGSLAGGGANGGNVNLGVNTLTTGDATNTTYAGVISGAGGSLAKAGTGTLTLSSANTYTGGTSLNAGTLAIGNDMALGTGGLTIGDGTTIHGVGVDRIIANNVTVGGDFAITSDDIMDFSGTVDLGGATRVITLNQASGGDVAFEGVVSNGGIDKQGDGILILDGNNTYAGGTTLTGGTLAVTHDNALGTGGLTIANGTTFAGFDGNRNIANAITVSGNFTIDGDTDPDMGAMDIEMLISGTVDLGGATRTVTVNTNTLAEAEISGVISNGGLVKDGPGLLILTGNNTYAGGTTLNSDSLALAHDNALGTGALTIEDGTTLIGLDANRTINNAVTVNGDFTIDGDPNPDMGDPDIEFLLSGNVDLGGATRTITVNDNTLAEAELGGVVSNGGLTKAGAGELILSGANTYTGTTTVNAGEVTLDGGAAIADTGAVVLADTAGVVLALEASETIGSLSGGGASGGNVDLGVNTLTVGDGTNTTYGGVISGAGGSLAKAGTGTLTLSSANTYTGGTSLNAGTLAIGDDASLGAGGLTIGNGTTVHGVGMERIIANNVTVGGDFAITSDDIMDFTGTVDLGGATRVITLVQASGGDSAFEGVISNGGIDKQGDGILILDGNNTYAGGTTLTAGTLELGHNNALGTGGLTIEAGTSVVGTGATLNISNALTVNGNFTIDGISDPDPGDPVTGMVFSSGVDLGAATRTITVNDNNLNSAELSGVISNGSLTKAGSGALILSGANTYTGTTTINAGAVTLNGGAAIDDTGAVVLADTAGVSLTLGASETIGSLAGGGSSGGNLNLGGNTLTTGDATNTAFGGVISGTGGLVKQGSGMLTLGGVNTFNGSVTLNAGTLVAGSGSDMTGSVTFNLAGGTFQNSSGQLVDFSSPTTISGNTTLAGEDAIGMGGATDLGGATRTLTITNTGGVNVTGVVSNGGIDKQGTGTLKLGGTNTYAGGTTLTTGTLEIGSDAALGTGAFSIGNGTTVHGVGMAREIANSVTVGGDFTITSDGVMDISGTVDLGAATRVITVGTGGDAAFDGVVSNGGIDKQGAGTLILAGNNTYAGNTTLTSGTLTVGHNNALGTGGLTVAASTTLGAEGTLTLTNALTVNGDFTIAGDPADPTSSLTLTSGIDLSANRQITVTNNVDATLSGVISESGGARSLTIAGDRTVTLSGANTYTGGTSLTGGTLLVGDDAALGTGALTLSAGTSLGGVGGTRTLTNAVTANGDFSLTGTSDLSLSGVISGAGGITKNSTGDLTLSATNTFTGTTTINAGAVTLNNGSAIADAAAVVLANAAGASLTFGTSETIGSLAGGGASGGNVILGANTLTMGDTTNTTYAGVISGAGGSLIKQGSGTLSLTGANTFTGGVTHNAGTIEVGHNNALGTGGLALANGATLGATGGAVQLTNALTIGNAFGFDGTQDLTLIDNLALASNLSVTVSNSGKGILGGVISGGFELTKLGVGTLELTGTNTYTGDTNINAGTLLVTGAIDNSTVNLGGGELVIGPNGSVSGNIGVGAGSSLSAGDSDSTLANDLDITGDFNIDGTNDLTLTGTVDLMGAVRQIAVQDAASTATITTPIAGTGGVTKAGNGTLTLDGANTYSGGTAINAGTLIINGSVTGTTAVAGGTLALGNDTALDTALTLTGGGNLQSQGGARTIPNTVAVTVNGDFGVTGSQPLDIAANVALGATPTVTTSNTTTMSGVISGGSGLTKAGTGTLVLSGTNTYSGNTNINAGTLVLDGVVAGDVLVNAAGAFPG